jgi:hypothetical protein
MDSKERTTMNGDDRQALAELRKRITELRGFL